MILKICLRFLINRFNSNITYCSQRIGLFLEKTSSSETKVERVLKIITSTSITIIFNNVIDIFIVWGLSDGKYE